MVADYFGAEVILAKDKKEGETLPFMDTAKLKRSAAAYMTPFKASLNEYLDLLSKKL
jgi:hypothetical protein